MDRDQPGLLAQPTRAALFAAIRESGGGATTEALARRLGLHVNGVRRHLDLMRGAGLLERDRLRHGRGRPRDVWSLAPAAAGGGENHADVARWLARAIPPQPAALRRVEETGRTVGRTIPVDGDLPLAEGIERAFTALGFEPAAEGSEGGTVTCRLGNCPYRAGARENPEAVCRLHRGLTVGLLEQLAPGSRLTRFEPHDPDEAGCVVAVAPAAAAG